MEPVVYVTPPNMDTVWREISRQIKALDRPDFPPDGVCSHLGIHFAVGVAALSMWADDRLCISVQPKSEAAPGRTPEQFAAFQEAWIKLFKRRADARWRTSAESWSFGNGVVRGLSMRVSRPSPKSLAVGTENYRKLGFEIFHLKPEQSALFSKWAEWRQAGLCRTSHAT